MKKKVKAREEVVPKQICKIPTLLCDALRQCGWRVAQTGRNIRCSFASLLSRWHKNGLSAFNDCGSVALSGLSSWQTPRADVRGPESFLLFLLSFFPPSSVSNEQLKLSKMSAATWRSKTASEREPQPVNAFGLWRGLKRSGEPRLSVSSIFSPLHAWNACGQETELIEIWYVTKVCFCSARSGLPRWPHSFQKLFETKLGPSEQRRFILGAIGRQGQTDSASVWWA